MLIGGALVNALAFTSSSYMFSRLSKNSINAERKRHNLAIEQLQKAQVEWALKDKSELTSSISNSGCHERVSFSNWGQAFTSTSRISIEQFLHPSNEQHERELAFIGLRMIGTGVVLWYLD